jgi:cytosine/adenosine deaminase-related metal-dependent hydrolase
MTLYLKDARYVDWRSLAVKQTHLAVSPEEQTPLGFPTELPGADTLAAGDRVMECRGKLVTKAFGCGHHHVYSALARGMPAPKKIPANFFEILQYIWWHLDKALDLEMIRASALVIAMAAAKNGITFVIDHHASPFAVEGSLATIAKAFDEVGVGHLLCYEISDRDGEAVREAGLVETANYLTSGRPGLVGLHASFTVGEKLLEKAVDLGKKCKTGIHVHVAEDRYDQKDCQERYGLRVVERFQQAGALDLPGTILAHCIHLSDHERSLVRQSGVFVAQNTESNLNNNVGVTGYQELGENIILGTDGMHSDMLRSAKAAFLTGQGTEGAGMETIYKRFRKVHDYIEMGGHGGDGENNLLILDYDAPTPVTGENFLGHFIFGLSADHVESVIAGGRLIVENRRPTLVDEGEVLGFAREMAGRLWKKMA